MKGRLLGIAGGVLVIVVVAWYLIGFRPESHRLASIKSQTASMQQSIPGLQAHLTSLQHEKALLSKRKALLAQYRKAIPTKADPADLIDQVRDLAKDSKVTLKSLSPQPPSSSASGSSTSASGATGVSTLQASVQVEGTYNEVISFVDGLYKLPRLVEVTSIQMSGGAAGAGGGARAGAPSAQVQASLQIEAFTTAAPVKG